MTSSCQDERLVSEDFMGEWNYEREFSSTFSYLLDLDKTGIIIYDSDGSGTWVGDLLLLGTMSPQYSYDVAWKLDEVKQQIEITKTPTLSTTPEEIRVYDIEIKGANRINLIYENEIVSILDPENVIEEFEYIYLTKS